MNSSKETNNEDLSENPDAFLRDLVKKIQAENDHFKESFQKNFASKEEEKTEKKNSPLLDFSATPRELKSYLDRFVIGQNDAKKALSIAVCDHYNHAKNHLQKQEENASFEYQKQNVLITGPTGVGKTYLIKHIAERIGVPFVKADATKFSETGYVGGDVDDLVRELITRADGDIERAQYGIIYIDEIDKLAGNKLSGGRDVSGRGVQTSLLKLMEETEVPATNPHDMKEQMRTFMSFQQGKGNEKQSINTRHILFVVSGSFSGLESIISRRIRAGQIGFVQATEPLVEEDELLMQASTQDFIDFGFESEFIGRLPIRVACQSLQAKHLEKILRYSEGSLLHQYEQEFRAYGIDLHFSDDAISHIAKEAAKQGTGARALMTICDSLLRDFKFYLSDSSIKELVVDAHLVSNPSEHLNTIRKSLEQNQRSTLLADLESYSKQFTDKYGLAISFTQEAQEALFALQDEENVPLSSLCNRLFKNLPYALQLLHSHTATTQFTLPLQAITHTQDYLNTLVTHSYQNE